MNGQEIRDRLLHSYERSYDIVKPSEVNGHTYDACASYHESGAKYVLSKKAELWRISCRNISDGPDRMDRAKGGSRGEGSTGYRPHVHAGHRYFFCGQTGCGQRKEENPKI